MNIHEKIAELAQLRVNRNKLHNEQQKMMLALQNSEPYMQLDLMRTQTDAEIERVTEEIRMKALEEFNGTKNKHPFDGVQIKFFTIVSITDETRAREWCLMNFRPALKLDAKVFEKAVKDGTIPADLAKVDVEPRAQISTDLSDYLKGQ